MSSVIEVSPLRSEFKTLDDFSRGEYWIVVLRMVPWCCSEFLGPSSRALIAGALSAGFR
jgi:hypothetical protein